GVKISAKTHRATMSRETLFSIRNWRARSPSDTNALSWRSCAGNVQARLGLSGGDSCSPSDWIRYSSENRLTTLMLNQSNASSFSTGDDGELAMRFQPSATFSTYGHRIEGRRLPFDSISR